MSHFQKHIFKNFPHVWPERSGWEMPPLEGWSKQTNRGNKGRGCFIQNSQNPCIAPYPNPGMLVDLPGFWEFCLQPAAPPKQSKQTNKQRRRDQNKKIADAWQEQSGWELEERKQRRRREQKTHFVTSGPVDQPENSEFTFSLNFANIL